MSEALLHPDEDIDPNVGLVLQDRYKIVRKIGEGGMGAVYEGEHIVIKRRVAIKCLHAQFAGNAEIVARFHREALAATSIGHENIVEVTDMGRFPDGSVFMVLEFLEGRDWSDDIDERGAQPVGKVVRILEQTCDALVAAHAKGIVHRDLKPENIFLITRSGNPDFVKVVDFGISKFKDPSVGQSMTQTGTAMGTPFYMSPEQAQGRKDIDHRSDIYSLGVILFQALTGQYPFDDEAYPMLVLKICTEPAPRADVYRPDLPPALVHVIERCLAKNPAERYSTCEELKAALEPFRDLDGAPVLDTTAPKTSSLTAAAMTGQSQNAEPTHSSSQVRLAHNATLPAGSVDGSFTGVGEVAAPLPTSKTPLIVGGLLALASLALVGGVLFGRSEGNQATTGAPPTTSTATQPPSATDAPADAPAADPSATARGAGEPAAPTASVTVEITTEPASAEVYLDGLRIPNPFDGELPQTTEPRRLEVRAEGYTTIAQDLVLQFPQRIRLRLERGSGMDDRSTSSRRGSSRPSSGNTGSVRSAAMSATETARAAAAAAAAALPPPPMVSPMEAAPPAIVAPAPGMTPTADTGMALKQIRF